MNISILYNKPAARFSNNPTHKAAEDDTEHSAIEVASALKSKGVTTDLSPVTEQTIEEVVNTLKCDLVFNLIEWTGQDTRLAMQTFDALTKNGLHYTGASKENYHDTCDKIITKRLCQKYGLPTAKWQEFVTGNETVDPLLTYPAIVKVSNEHSSVGITKDSIVPDAIALSNIAKQRISEFRQPVFAETFLTGREFQVTLLEKKEGLAVLPIAEIVYTKGTHVPLLTYESRWNEKHSDYKNSEVDLARIDSEYERKIRTMCISAYTAFGFRDYARFDIRCDAHTNPYFLELNSNPGLGDDPDYGMTVSYKAAEMNFADFVWEIVQSALRRKHSF